MSEQHHPLSVFSGNASRELSEKIFKYFNPSELKDYTFNKFADGEIEIRINDSIRGGSIFIIQSTFSPIDNLFELLMLIDTCKRASAHYITAVVPYFGFARQDKKHISRVSIGAKMVANLLQASGIDRIITMDLHAQQIQGFFDVNVDHLKGKYLFIPYVRSLNLPDLVIASPDMGGAARAREFAKHFNDYEIIICDKVRSTFNKVDSIKVIGEVKNKNVVLIDDICDTAGTLAKTANTIKDMGAKTVRAVCTHPVLSGNALKTIEDSALLELVVSDTIPIKKQSDKITVLSSAELFAKAMKAVYEYESIDKLFTV